MTSVSIDFKVISNKESVSIRGMHIIKAGKNLFKAKGITKRRFYGYSKL